MNNIYKVIWSKAKNCYVVASEIARSHTKSASGSEKIGGGTRRKLLASLMALSLLCGGLGVANAVDYVHVEESATSTTEVYTAGKVDTLLNAKADKTALENKANAADVALNTEKIATNKAAIQDLNNNKLDKTLANNTFATKDALGDKANTDLSNLTADGVNKIKNTMKADMDLKANKAEVNDALDGKADKATVTDLATKVGDASSGLVNDVATLNTALGTKADQSGLDAATQRITTNEGNITDLQNKTGQLSADGKELKDMTTVSGTTVSGTNVEAGALKVTGVISDDAGVTTTLEKIDASMTQTVKNKEDIANLKTKTDGQQTAINGLNEKTTQISYDAANHITSVNGMKVGQQVDMGGKDIINAGALTATGKVTGDGLAAGTGAITGGSLTVTGKVTGNGVDAGTGDITTRGNVNGATLETTGNATIGGALTATGKVTGDGLAAGTGAITGGSLTVTGKVTGNGVDAGAGAITGGSLSVTGDTSLKKTDVDGALNVTGESSLKNTKVDGTLGVIGATTLEGTLTAEKDATFEKDVTVKGTTNLQDTTVTGDLKVTGTITTDKMVFGVKPNNYTEIDQGKVTSKNSYINGAAQLITSSSTFDAEKNEVGFTNTATGDQSYHKQTAKGINGSVTDKDGNKTYTKVTATENSFQVQDNDGKNKNHQVNTKDSSKTEITNADGKTTTTEQTATDIINTAKDGTIKNEANHIENTATTMKTTVNGQATENFNGGLDTTVTGAENHTVTGKQTNTVEGGQENIISGGQTNTITGGQINNITGDQTTTITGNKTETVTENVTEDYKKDLTTTVGGNETHEVKGTKTETVEGKVTENFKNGQETNVTGDQDIKVSGTQTTTATDINRNASSSMVDKVDNAYGTNTETKEAGKTTTDVSIKGTGEKGQYIRGANESRDYLINGTLKNSETKTAEATSSAITDGTNTASTRQDAKNLAGSVTNGAETGVSGIHANDDGSVSIDSAVVGGGMSSVINQKKDSIKSAVGDGTNSTVILQDKDNVTIASSNGTVGIVGKDIVNNATGNMTNTVGGNQTNTIGGDQTTTVTGDISNTAKNITNEASNSITDKVGDHTRVLDGEGITDTVGGSTFKQRIDKIMMESKDVSIKAEETLTNEAKVITNKASEVINNEAIDINNTATGIINSKASEIKNQADKLISNKVGENTSEYMEDGKITTSIKDGTKSTVTIQNADGLQTGVTNGTSTNASATTATSSAQTIASGNKANSVITTIDGTQFVNSEAATPVTGASGAGNAVNTTIKGNTITTGKVTMDYADVMKDLGVRGNANINGKTTTGSLEVTGTSTLKGDVTMENNATVGNNLTVNGTTKTKTLSVTENATVGGTLDVTGKATFKDSVDIAKDLAVGGNATITGDVTAKSYKVGDKTYISADGINANDQKITNVADGSISEGSKDAVNGGQLYGVKRDLEHQVDKVGANAAAMANLRPMEFDPSSKWNIAAAIGNYGSETAAALGAFYRPNDDVMVNLSTAFGTGENMVGGGVSVRLGKGSNKLSREESNALKDQVDDLTARMDALLSVLNPNMSKDFPDVPENHWAYEAVSRLAGNDIVQGYPDGEFHGERTMTRYEMAEIIYNALSRGAEAERELVEEFKPELQAMAASEKATAERAEG